MRAKGFTLMELAIVIAIIGILTAVAVPRFVDLTAQANQANVDATVAAVRSAYAIAVAQARGVPDCLQILGSLEGGTLDTDGTTWRSTDGSTTVTCDARGDYLAVQRGTIRIELSYPIDFPTTE